MFLRYLKIYVNTKYNLFILTIQTTCQYSQGMAPVESWSSGLYFSVGKYRTELQSNSRTPTEMINLRNSGSWNNVASLFVTVQLTLLCVLCSWPIRGLEKIVLFWLVDIESECGGKYIVPRINFRPHQRLYKGREFFISFLTTGEKTA